MHSFDDMPYNNDIFYQRYCLDEELDSNSIASGSNGGSDVSTRWLVTTKPVSLSCGAQSFSKQH
jgi:hypothetical protein